MYLTISLISRPIVAANNKGETIGNLQTLQKLRTSLGMFTVLSGYALKYAVRENMNTLGASLWRVVLPENDAKANPAGFGYATDSSNPSKDRVFGMKDAMPKAPKDFDDTILFGYMVAPAGKDADATKKAGNVEFSPAVSTTPYTNDQAFCQGLKADGRLNPFSAERHYTRYANTVNINLDGIKDRPQALGYLLDALRSLRVGGSHGSNASELSPAVVMWRFHMTPGCGGLYLGMVKADPDKEIDLDPVKAEMVNQGIMDVTYAGLYKDAPKSTPTVKEAFDTILKQSAQYLK